MKFLDFFTPEMIDLLCKEGRVSVTIKVVDRNPDPVYSWDDGGRLVENEEEYEQIVHMSGREIRSWHDLFQFDNPESDNDKKKAHYLSDNERELLR